MRWDWARRLSARWGETGEPRIPKIPHRPPTQQHWGLLIRFQAALCWLLGAHFALFWLGVSRTGQTAATTIIALLQLIGTTDSNPNNFPNFSIAFAAHAPIPSLILTSSRSAAEHAEMVSTVCSRRGHLQALSAQHPATEPAQTSMPGQALSTIPTASKAPAPMSTLVSVDLASVQPKKMRKAARNPNWDAAQAPVRLYYRSLCAYHDPYLTTEAESILGITVVLLDLSSGYMSDGGPRFIEPASSIDMASFVDRNRPWEDAPLEPIGRGDHDHPRNLEGKPWEKDVKLHEGRFMLGALRAFGHTPYDDDDDLPAFNNDWGSDFGYVGNAILFLPVLLTRLTVIGLGCKRQTRRTRAFGC